MPVRFESAFALFLVLAGGELQAQGFQYAAGTGSFDVVSTTKIAQEAMGQKQEIEIASSQILTLAIVKKAGDTLGLSVRVDSIEVNHSVGGPVDVSAVQGLTVSADLSPRGAVHTVQVPEGLDVNQADQLARLMPPVLGVLKVGTTWVDTIAGDVTQSGLVMQRRIITTARVAGDTVANGERGWRIVRESRTTVAGSGEVQGQPLSVEGTGTGGGTWVVSSNGRFLGATLSDEMSTRVTMSATGMEVNGITTAVTTVSRRG